MNNIISMALKLLIICSTAAFSLGVVNALTAPEIQRLEDDAKAKALSELISVGIADANEENIVEDNDFVSSYYFIKDGNDKIGYILYLNAKGYGGLMTVMASYENDGQLIDAILMNNQETPGFGKKAEKSGYMDKFKGFGNRGNDLPLYGYQVEESVDTISGATITFMGISSALKSGSDYIKGGL